MLQIFIFEMRIFLSLFFLGLLVKNQGVKAQETALDPIVVTGNLHKQKLKETGRNIIVINKEDIEKITANSLDELLKYLPGIEVQQRGPQGAQSDIVIRGGTFQQILVIIDGVRLNDPLTGHFNSYIPIHPNEIERIEILKGSAAAVFGPDAVGGVIHIITKSNTSTKQKKGIQFFGSLQTGDYGLFNRSMFTSIARKGTYISLGYQKLKANGIPLRGTKGYFNNDNLVFSFAHQFKKDWHLMFRAANDTRDFNAQNFYTSFLSDTANENVKSSFQQLEVSKKFTKSAIEILVGAKQLKDVYYFRPTSIPNDNKSTLNSLQLNYNYKINERNTFISGVQTFSKTIRSNDRGDHDHSHVGIFSIFTHTLPYKIVVTESLRSDWDQAYKWVILPQVNLAWSPSKFNVRFSTGKSIRDADFTERYNNYNKALVTGGSIGNPDLVAEKAWNTELGIDYNFSSDIQIKSSIFQRNQQQLIDWIITPYGSMPRKSNLSNTGTYALASNISAVNTRGFEMDLLGKKQFSKNTNFQWMSGLVWLDSKTPSGTQPSFYLSSHAKFIWNGFFQLSYKKTSIGVSGIYKSRNVLEASGINAKISANYFLLNVKLEQKLFKNKGALFIQSDNLTNTKYSDQLGSIMPGRWWSGGIKFSIYKN